MSTEIDGVPFVSAEAAARVLGTTQLKILMLLKEKKLSGECLDGAWYVSAPSLGSYRKEEPGGEAPRCRTTCSASRCGCH